MPRLFSIFPVGLYILMIGLILGINWRGHRNNTETPSCPNFKIVREHNPGTDRAFKLGVPRLDLTALKSSVNRLPSISLMRQLGNSLRIACGQKLNWIIWGGRRPLMLFPDSELWASEGIDAGRNREMVESASAVVKKYAALLKAEGWTLVVVPVPTKLSIHRDRCEWPVLDKDLLTRHPVIQDRADEINDALFKNFSRDEVNFVDLRAVYRTHLAKNPDDLLYPPGESHWAGLGIKLAAEATATKVAALTGIGLKHPTPTFLEVDRTGDMISAFDAYPEWLNRLRPLYVFHDRLVNGEHDKGYVYADAPQSLLVVAGTSYTGQYTWLIGHPVGFTWVIGGMLEECEIQNRPFAGLGSFYAFRRFLEERETISRDFMTRRNVAKCPKVVVWEFPLRDLAVIVGQ